MNNTNRPTMGIYMTNPHMEISHYSNYSGQQLHSNQMPQYSQQSSNINNPSGMRLIPSSYPQPPNSEQIQPNRTIYPQSQLETNSTNNINSQLIQYVPNGNWTPEQSLRNNINSGSNQQQASAVILSVSTPQKDQQGILSKEAPKASNSSTKTSLKKNPTDINKSDIVAPAKPKNVYRHLCPECDKP